MRGHRFRRYALALTLPLLVPALAACGTPEAGAGSGELSELGLANAAEPRPGLLTAGQPSQGQVERLRALGYENFISLRPASEPGAGWEEERLDDGSFQRIPVAGPDDLTRETVEALDRALAEAGDEPTVVYCASSNRVGALLALRAHWLEGMDADAALDLGRRAGLTGLEPAVRALLEEGEGAGG